MKAIDITVTETVTTVYRMTADQLKDAGFPHTISELAEEVEKDPDPLAVELQDNAAETAYEHSVSDREIHLDYA